MPVNIDAKIMADEKEQQSKRRTGGDAARRQVDIDEDKTTVA